MTQSFAVEVSNVDVDSAATNFQHLSLQKEDQAAANSADDNPAVIIPDHLQLENTDCAHLSFGSFESGAFSGLLPSKVPKYSMEEVPNSDETPAVDQIDIRCKLISCYVPTHDTKCILSYGTFLTGIKITMTMVLYSHQQMRMLKPE